MMSLNEIATSGDAVTNDGNGTDQDFDESLIYTSTGQFRAFVIRRVIGVVHWYNPQKGFGFIQVEGHPDAHLPAGVVERYGVSTLYKETIVDCDVTVGQRSQVITIHAIDDTNAAIPLHRPKPAPEIEYEVFGVVKFFHEDDKGFGFIETENGDIFVHVSGVKRSGLESIYEGERYMCGIGRNEKGPIVLRLTPLDDDGEDVGDDESQNDDAFDYEDFRGRVS